jgi:hypothetical protein
VTSLDELARRGGLDASEALAVLNGQALWDKRRLPWREANARLARMLAAALSPELTAT